jgi:hypothetical protein
MKKVIAILAVLTIMIGSLGMGAYSVSANYYEDIPDALPAEPAH